MLFLQNDVGGAYSRHYQWKVSCDRAGECLLAADDAYTEAMTIIFIFFITSSFISLRLLIFELHFQGEMMKVATIELSLRKEINNSSTYSAPTNSNKSSGGDYSDKFSLLFCDVDEFLKV